MYRYWGIPGRVGWGLRGGALLLQLSAVKGVTIYGPPPSRGRAALCTFNVEGLHATDVSTLLDQAGGTVFLPIGVFPPPRTFVDIWCSLQCIADHFFPAVYVNKAERMGTLSCQDRHVSRDTADYLRVGPVDRRVEGRSPS